MNMLLAAIAKVATVDADGNLVIDRAELVKAVRETKDFDGLTGTLTCDAKGDCGVGSIAINVVQDGVCVPVEVPAELQPTK